MMEGTARARAERMVRAHVRPRRVGYAAGLFRQVTVAGRITSARDLMRCVRGLAALLPVALALAPGLAPAPRLDGSLRAPRVRMGAIEPAAPVLHAGDMRDALSRALDKNPRKYVALLGSTGSIGTQTLDICREYAESFEVVSLAAGSNVELLSQQIAEFRPKVVGLADASKESELRERLSALGAAAPEIVVGSDAQTAVATAPGADTVVTGVVGCAGLLPTVEAIKLGRTIALANKETLIAGGPVILPLLRKCGAKMTPADSEHSAIFQCLQVRAVRRCCCGAVVAAALVRAPSSCAADSHRRRGGMIAGRAAERAAPRDPDRVGRRLPRFLR